MGYHVRSLRFLERRARVSHRYRRRRRLRAAITASGPHMAPEKRVHEVFVDLVMKRRAAERWVAGTRPFKAELQSAYREVLSKPQRSLDGLTGQQWLEREAPEDGSKGFVVTRIGPVGRAFVTTLYRRGEAGAGVVALPRQAI